VSHLCATLYGYSWLLGNYWNNSVLWFL